MYHVVASFHVKEYWCPKNIQPNPELLSFLVYKRLLRSGTDGSKMPLRHVADKTLTKPHSFQVLPGNRVPKYRRV